MDPKRPTYSEHWHRVESLRPRLRAGVRTMRRHFRGEPWHILEDPLGAGLGGKAGGHGAYFRLNESAYRFVALLDGTRTVGQAWRLASDTLGDDAPTQPEAVTLLGQLGASNLLQGDLPEDARTLFRRYRSRRGREIKGALASMLAVRVPLIDPDRFLNAVTPVLGRAFTRWGLAAWLLLVVAGLSHLAGRGPELMSGAGGILSAGNLGWLYGAFVLSKVLHELGHGVACKWLARREGAEAPVHAMGVMLLVFMPAPYVDATSAWLIRSKWSRIVVGAAGMYVELALAAVAAMVWARTSEGTVAHAVAYNLIFIAGVSTLVFNANPLMKYDGYYMLADLLETPNLAQRARDQTHHLVQRYAWRVRESVPVAPTRHEAAWLVLYHLASSAYRWVVFVGITLFVMDQWLLAGAAIGALILVAQGAVPLGKLAVFIASSPRLNKTRSLAAWTTASAAALVLLAVGAVPFPDRIRLAGVVAPAYEEHVFAPDDGFIESEATPGARLVPGDGLLRLSNESLRAERDIAEARVRAARLEADRARVDNPLKAREATEKLAVLQELFNKADERLAMLRVIVSDQTSSRPVVWSGLEGGVSIGSFVRRGEPLGKLLTPEGVRIDAVADQRAAARLTEASRIGRLVGEVRLAGVEGEALRAEVHAPSPAGRVDLRHPALADHAGGPIRLQAAGPRGGAPSAAEPYFDVRVEIEPPSAGDKSVLPGRRATVRVDLPKAPLLAQWLRSIRQTFQQRFGL